MAETRRPPARLQPLLLGIGFALLIAVSGGSVMLVNQAAEDTRLLAETSTVQDKLAVLLLAVRRAESAKRGYLFTGDESYLAEYSESEPEAKTLIDQLRAVAAANPNRKRLLDRADALINDKFKEMSEVIALNRQGDRLAARNRVLQGRDQAMTASLRRIIESAIVEESQIAQVRSDQSRTTNNRLLILSLAGAALIALIGVLSVLLVQRNAKLRELARGEIEVTNANLERIVAYRTADLTEANEEIQRFAYIVSHDLRSPLVNIMGFTSELEALRKDIFERVEKLQIDLAARDAPVAESESAPIEQLGHDFDEAIRFIKSSIGNMDRLIGAVLKLSREGRRQFAPETIDVRALMDSVVQTVAHRAAELSATITVDHLPPVESDRLALEQIFANLVDNALKYGRAEEPLKIQISGQTDGLQVVYSVKDNGRGIDFRDHQRVFELFRRSGAQDRPGEGIGLAHVRALVRRLGGTMSLNSELGQGSTFAVTLPRRWAIERRNAA